MKLILLLFYIYKINLKKIIMLLVSKWSEKKINLNTVDGQWCAIIISVVKVKYTHFHQQIYYLITHCNKHLFHSHNFIFCFAIQINHFICFSLHFFSFGKAFLKLKNKYVCDKNELYLFNFDRYYVTNGWVAQW